MKPVATVKEVGAVLVAHGDLTCTPSVEFDRDEGRAVITIELEKDRLESLALHDDLKFVADVAQIRAFAATYGFDAEQLEAAILAGRRVPELPRDASKAVAFLARVRAILKDESGEWSELKSCADAVQDISMALEEAGG